jgi:asparagine synthase (glutamine-hydrolysing)
MCGFCGIVYPSASARSVDPALLSRMNATLHHRGPDASGLHQEPGVSLAHCRLSIIDLGGGAQPMTSASGQQVLIFNGEIYNFQQLRQDLQAKGRVFKTNSDTEVILHLYDQYGLDSLRYLRGMFAFALWDRPRKRLFLARDRMGKKPLVYTALPGNGIAFASEAKALLEHPDVSREIDREAIDLYLTYQYIPSPYTIFKSIRKLPPAHFAVWEDGKMRLERYWDVSFKKKTTLSVHEATDELMDKLRESVKLRMIADVPLGAFLSGGIDSGLIVGLMSEVSTQPVKTYSIGFEDQAYSELPFARLVAKKFGCDHHEFIVKPETAEILPRLAWHYGEPFADPSALPSYIVARETRRHVTVALNGDGGDENFAGYYRYAAMRLLKGWDHLPQGVRHLLGTLAREVSIRDTPNSNFWRLRRLMMLGDQSPPERYLRLVDIYTKDQKQALYSNPMREQMASKDARSYLFSVLANAQADDNGIDPYLYADLRTYLPECLMTKMDIASMAVSLETRSPMLDHEFIELVATLPPEWKWKPLLQTKWILRQGLKNWLPDSILQRGKQGFGIPVGQWFRGELKGYTESVLLSSQAEKRGYFDPVQVRRMLTEHQTRRHDHSERLWALLMLELWHQVYIDKTHSFP